MADNMPAWEAKWLHKRVEWTDKGVQRTGLAVGVERYVRDNRPWIRLRILGDNGYIYPGVEERLCSGVR